MGMIDGLIMGAIASGIARSEFKKQLNECVLTEQPEGVDVFHYKGKIYDREKFVLLEMGRLRDVKYASLKSAITAAEKDIEKGSEDAELIAAQLSAYLRVLPQKKKPLFSIDDVL